MASLRARLKEGNDAGGQGTHTGSGTEVHKETLCTAGAVALGGRSGCLGRGARGGRGRSRRCDRAKASRSGSRGSRSRRGGALLTLSGSQDGRVERTSHAVEVESSREAHCLCGTVWCRVGGLKSDEVVLSCWANVLWHLVADGGPRCGEVAGNLVKLVLGGLRASREPNVESTPGGSLWRSAAVLPLDLESLTARGLGGTSERGRGRRQFVSVDMRVWRPCFRRDSRDWVGDVDGRESWGGKGHDGSDGGRELHLDKGRERERA